MKNLRLILIVLLSILTFFNLALIGVGSHGNFSFENAENAILFFGSISLLLTALAQSLILIKKSSRRISLWSLALTVISGFFLIYQLNSLIEFNGDGGHFPIAFLVMKIVALIICGLMVVNDARNYKKTGYNTV